MLESTFIIIIDDSALIAASIEQIAIDLGGRPLVYMHADRLFSDMSAGTVMTGIAVADGQTVSARKADIIAWLGKRNIPLILLSTEPVGGNDELEAYATTIISKPFSDEELSAAISALA